MEENTSSRADSTTRLATRFGDTDAQHSAGPSGQFPELRLLLIGLSARAGTMHIFPKQCAALAAELRGVLSAREDLLEALKTLIPTNINLDHPGLADDVVLPCDVTLGELRGARAAISKAEAQS